MTAADVLVEALIDWGVEVIFGLPGNSINGIMESLRTDQDKIRFVQVRHEESAALMACGYAKFTGRLGVCLATSGPGGIHLLNGLYDAKLDNQPVLAITGLQFHDLIGTYTQQDVALDKLFMDVAVFNERIMGPTHVENITDLACRTAIAYRSVAHITFPVDLQEKELKERQRSKRNVPHHTSDAYSRSARLPNRVDLAKAAEILNRGKKVAILAGRGALNATDELEQTAELLAAPIVKALLGKAAVPDDSPYTTGGIGLLGTKPSQEAMEDWWEVMEKRATRRDKPMKPQVVAWELGKRLRDDAIVSCDSGTIATWWARHILARRGQMHTLSGNLATMAPGLPYTIAAQIAFPNRQCVSFVGDGGFSMLMAEFATAVKYKLPIKAVIIKNNTLGQIKWEQMVFLGNPEYGVDLHPIDFVAFAHACGGVGYNVEDP